MRKIPTYLAMLLIISFMAASCSSSRSYPNYSSSQSSKYNKKSNKKYGHGSQRSMPIKKNYKIKD